MAMSENTVRVLNYLKEHNGEQLTAADVAADLGIDDKRKVDGSFTALTRKHLGVRTPAEIELEDGTHKAIKFIKATQAGLDYDHEAAVAADAAAAASAE